MNGYYSGRYQQPPSFGRSKLERKAFGRDDQKKQRESDEKSKAHQFKRRDVLQADPSGHKCPTPEDDTENEINRSSVHPLKERD